MIWPIISQNSHGPLAVLHGRINAKYYLSILPDHVYPMVQALFPDGRAVFQDDNVLNHMLNI